MGRVRIAAAMGVAAATLLVVPSASIARQEAAVGVERAGAPVAWPVRVAPAGQPEAKGVIRALSDVAALRGFQSGVRAPSAQDAADVAALLGDGPADRVRFEGPGSFIYRPTRTPVAADPNGKTERPKGPAPEYFVFVSGAPGAEAGKPPAIQRTWFAFYSGGEQARGIALLMPGMLGTPEPILDLVATRLQKQGWAVLRMMCQPSRFTEHVVFDIDLKDPGPASLRMAAELGERVAECGYAVEAAMGHVTKRHPTLASLPRIALGMSGGAMILPTVVAREPERYAAAVLIAGGCNFFEISDQSNYKYMINAVDFRWLPGPPTDEQRSAIDKLYLDASPLDGYHTATVLKGKPVLLLHAQFDMGVPAAYGDLLWERLGKPERWVERAGHEELFGRLPRQVDKILAWLDEHVPSAAASR